MRPGPLPTGAAPRRPRRRRRSGPGDHPSGVACLGCHPSTPRSVATHPPRTRRDRPARATRCHLDRLRGARLHPACGPARGDRRAGRALVRPAPAPREAGGRWHRGRRRAPVPARSAPSTLSTPRDRSVCGALNALKEVPGRCSASAPWAPGAARGPALPSRNPGRSASGPGRGGGPAAIAQQVTLDDIRILDEMAQVFAGLAAAYGGAHARSAPAAYLSDDVGQLFVAATAGQIRRDVLSGASRLSHLLASMTQDAGNHSLAQRHYRAALALGAGPTPRPTPHGRRRAAPELRPVSPARRCPRRGSEG